MDVLICFILGIIIGFFFATIGAKSKFEELYQDQHSILDVAANIAICFEDFRKKTSDLINEVKKEKPKQLLIDAIAHDILEQSRLLDNMKTENLRILSAENDKD